MDFVFPSIYLKSDTTNANKYVDIGTVSLKVVLIQFGLSLKILFLKIIFFTNVAWFSFNSIELETAWEPIGCITVKRQIALKFGSSKHGT